MRFEFSDEITRQARHPHEIFLINLITNHILIFVGLLGMAKTAPWVMLVTPSVSLAIISYLLFRAKRSISNGDHWFVMAHWQLCARRSKMFIVMLLLMAVAMLLVLIVSGGAPKPQHFALGGAAVLPTMVTVLVLIVMESDAMHQARHGLIPDGTVGKYPHPDDIKPVEG